MSIVMTSGSGRTRTLSRLALLVVAALAVYFLYDNVLRFR